jgi:hypothetical protein
MISCHVSKLEGDPQIIACSQKTVCQTLDLLAKVIVSTSIVLLAACQADLGKYPWTVTGITWAAHMLAIVTKMRQGFHASVSRKGTQ